MKHILEATRGEGYNDEVIPWYLVIYDDEKEEIKEITEYQYKREKSER